MPGIDFPIAEAASIFGVGALTFVLIDLIVAPRTERKPFPFFLVTSLILLSYSLFTVYAGLNKQWLLLAVYLVGVLICIALLVSWVFA